MGRLGGEGHLRYELALKKSCVRSVPFLLFSPRGRAHPFLLRRRLSQRGCAHLSRQYLCLGHLAALRSRRARASFALRVRRALGAPLARASRTSRAAFMPIRSRTMTARSSRRPSALVTGALPSGKRDSRRMRASSDGLLSRAFFKKGSAAAPILANSLEADSRTSKSPLSRSSISLAMRLGSASDAGFTTSLR